MDTTPEARRFRAQDAKSLLENPMLVQAFSAVNDYLDASALSCDPDNAEKARRIVISKQLLAAVKREIERVVSDGVVAELQIAEIEQKRKLFQFRR